VTSGRDGRPIAEANVMLCLRDPCEDEPLADFVTDDDGTFEVEPDGDAGPLQPRALVVRADGFLEAALRGPELAAAARPGGVEVTLEPAPRVHGRVRAPDGSALEGVRVGVFQRSAAEEIWDLTGDTGEYRLESAPTGEVTVYAILDDHEEVQAALGHLSLRPGDERTLDFTLSGQRAHKVTGRVVDRLGRPLAWVGLTVEEPASASTLDRVWAQHLGGQSIQTGVDGTFELALVSPGPHHVKLWAWSPEDKQLLAQADLYASEHGRDDTVTVWDADIVHCSLRDGRGRAVRISRYTVGYERTDGDGCVSSIRIVGSSGWEPGLADQLSFPWARSFASLSVRLAGEGIQGEALLRGPAERCELSGQ